MESRDYCPLMGTDDPKAVLAEAIREEERARDNYVRCREMSKDPALRVLFSGLAADEASHAAKLRNLLEFMRIYEKRTVEAEQEALIDPLTGLGNRRFLDRTLEDELNRARRLGVSLGLLLLDLDYFKAVNDFHGHAVGDALLRDVSGTLTEQIRRGVDFVFRWGGEEFVILSTGASREGLRVLAEKVRTSVKLVKVPTRDGGTVSVDVSIGAALFPKDGSDVDDLFRAADAALYVAKQSGRDKVVFASDVPTGGNGSHIDGEGAP